MVRRQTGADGPRSNFDRSSITRKKCFCSARWSPVSTLFSPSLLSLPHPSPSLGLPRSVCLLYLSLKHARFIARRKRRVEYKDRDCGHARPRLQPDNLLVDPVIKISRRSEETEHVLRSFQHVSFSAVSRSRHSTRPTRTPHFSHLDLSQRPEVSSKTQHSHLHPS